LRYQHVAPQIEVCGATNFAFHQKTHPSIPTNQTHFARHTLCSLNGLALLNLSPRTFTAPVPKLAGLMVVSRPKLTTHYLARPFLFHSINFRSIHDHWMMLTAARDGIAVHARAGGPTGADGCGTASTANRREPAIRAASASQSASISRNAHTDSNENT